MSIGKNTVSGELLRSYVERLENLAAQKKQLSDDGTAVIAEAKSKGFVPAAIRYCLKVRKQKPSDRQEAEALADSYLHALGMATDTPLFRHVDMMSVDITSRDQVIEAMKRFVPASGSITIEAGGKPVRLQRNKGGSVLVTDVVEAPTQADIEDETPRRGKVKPDVPDCSPDEAEVMGRQAFRDDQPIVNNPFPFNDARRPRWDKGWREESGGDGMD